MPRAASLRDDESPILRYSSLFVLSVSVDASLPVPTPENFTAFSPRKNAVAGRGDFRALFAR
jgi:hypothetical protein